MTTLLKTMCIAAGVSMAALAATGAAFSAQAAEQPVRIQVGDLDLNTPQGRATFDVRVNRAARQLCDDQRDLGLLAACKRAVREEAMDNLTELARRDGVDLASVHR
jgi:UrcA family protein